LNSRFQNKWFLMVLITSVFQFKKHSMAHLEVQPKKSKSSWMWILVVIIIIGLLIFFFKGCGQASNSNALNDSSSSDTSMEIDKAAVATTSPDWGQVDFNGPSTSDPDITDTDIAVSGNENYTTYTLGENILFPTGKNVLQESASEKLKQITASLNKRFKGANIGVYGSTDSKGAANKNQELGAERAAAVKEWLVKSGMEASKISIHSLGESTPVASNSTQTGRKQNRNVSIVAFPAPKSK
jgi:outer membrane protein OmpA-like peptidoglycan-associated protein